VKPVLQQGRCRVQGVEAGIGVVATVAGELLGSVRQPIGIKSTAEIEVDFLRI